MARLRATAWGVLIYNLAVILWGAFVRATGSGAGCGEHWPTCNGQLLPRDPSLETAIEFTHRATSGLALLSVVALLLLARRATPPGSAPRRAATASMIFMVLEAAVGAVLVLFSLTATDTSLARAAVMGVHLVNTFLLLACLTLTALWSSGLPPARLRGQGLAPPLLLAAALGLLVLGVSGAIAALGDTLFPATSLAEGLRQDLSPGAHFLLRLRVLHPLLALGVGAGTAAAAVVLALSRRDRRTRAFAAALVLIIGAQIAVGFTNLALLAPVWLQLTHLLLADLLWLCFIALGASALADQPRLSAST